MREVTTQTDARKVRKLSFCYLCGVEFNSCDVVNRDHVPPSTIFREEDRDFPLKLPTHQERCHSPLNHEDEVIGQLINLLHGIQPDPSNDKLRIQRLKDRETGKDMAAYSGKNLELLVFRWIKAFHAALYKQPLIGNKGWVKTPFPSVKMSAGVLVEEELGQNYEQIVDAIRRNRATNSLDRIRSNNGHLRYECVWAAQTDGQWYCMFALDIYDWIELGDINNFNPQGCVGLYKLDTGLMPMNASKTTSLAFDVVSAIANPNPFKH